MCFCFCAAVSVSVLPLKRGQSPLETLPLSADDTKSFLQYLELVTETVREFFKNTYHLHVTSFHSDTFKCNVFSVDALDKFWNDLENGSARINFEKALDLCETDPTILLEFSAREYFKAKEFFDSLDIAQSHQR